MATKKETDQLEADRLAQEKAEAAAEKLIDERAEMTEEERAESRRAERANLRAPKKRYTDLVAGEYAATYGGEDHILKLTESYETTDPGIQHYIENVIGREGTLVE